MGVVLVAGGGIDAVVVVVVDDRFFCVFSCTAGVSFVGVSL